MGSALKTQLHPPLLKMIACGGGATDDEESPTATLMTTKSPVSMSCCHVPYLFLLKQVGWRIRSRWRHYLLRRRRCNAALRFSYDLRSYSLNFDDGGRLCVQDRRSLPSLAP